MDRLDIQIDVPAVTPADLALPPCKEGTAEVAARVARARLMQLERNGGRTNAELTQDLLDHVAELFTVYILRRAFHIDGPEKGL